MPKNIDILNDDEFQRLPRATRDGVLYRLHEVLLESAMSGGFCEQLVDMRDSGRKMDRLVVLVLRTNDPLFPPEMLTDKSPPYHRELFDLDEPPAWVMAIPNVKKRIAETVGKMPKAIWLIKDGDNESPKEERLADLWGITYMDTAAILHAIDLDVQMDFQHERAKPKEGT